MRHLVVSCFVLLSTAAFAQTDAGVIINEIANSGSKKTMYTGGDYVELLVISEEGAKLAGWYLSDLSSPSGTAKESEGSVKFSEKEGSVFLNIIPRGTYILICLGKKGESHGSSAIEEDVSLTDGNNRIVVFAYNSPQHIEPGEGTISLTGKDGVAISSAWKKDAAVSVVTWGGSSSWTGCKAVELVQESLDNGKIAYFAPKGETGFMNSSNSAAWESTGDVGRATPGKTNAGVDDEGIGKK